MNADPARTPRPRRRLRRVIPIALVLVLILATGVAFGGPIVAARLLPGIVEAAANPSLAGRLEVGSASAAWFGPQKLRSVRLLDPEGDTVATLEVEIDGSLVPLALGSMNYGRVRVTGSADIIRRADGSTNLERTLAPLLDPPQPSTEPAALPPDTNIELVLDALAIRVADEPSGRTASIDPLDGRAVVAVGRPIEAELSGRARAGGGTPGKEGPGTLSARARIEQWADASGLVTTDAMAIDASLSADGVPAAWADAIAGLGGRAEAALAGDFRVRAQARGSMTDLEAEFTLDAPGGAADAGFTLAGREITASRPASLALETGSMGEIAPALRDTLERAGEQMTLDAAPRLTLSFDSFRARLPEPGQAFDPRTIDLDARLSSPPLRGSLTAAEPARAFALDGLDAGLTLERGGRVSLTANAGATIDETDAGRVEVDLALDRLFDEGGSLATPSPREVEGVARLTGLRTELVQPLLAGSGIEVRRAIGPTLDVAIEAGPSDLRLEASADHAAASGRFEILEDRLRLTGDGLSARLDQAGAIAGAALNAPGRARIAPRGGATLHVRTLEAPLEPASLDELLGAMRMRGELSATDWRLDPHPNAPRGTPPLAIQSLSGTLAMSPGEPARAELAGEMAHGNQKLSASGSLALRTRAEASGSPSGGPAPDTTSARAQTVDALLARRPSGHLEVSGVPPRLIDVIAPDIGAQRSAGWTGSRVIAGPASGRLDLTTDDAGESLAIRGSLNAGNLTGEVRAGASTERISLRRARASGDLNQRGINALLAAFSPETDPPRLNGTALIELAVSPVELGLDGSSDQPISASLTVDRAEIRSYTLGAPATAPGPGATQGPQPAPAPGASQPAPAEPANPIDTGPLALEGFKLSGTIPGAALTGGEAAKPAAWTAEGRLARPDGALLGRMTGSGTLPLGAGAGSGAGPAATVRLAALDSAWLDSLAGTEDMLAGGLGKAMALDLELAPGERAGTQRISLGAESPRLETRRPMVVELGPDRARTLEPWRATWDIHHAWANRSLLGADAALSLAKPVQADLRLGTLSIARGEGRGPARPGVFALDADLETGPIEFGYSDRSGDRFERLTASLKTDQEGRALRVDGDLRAGEGQAARSVVRLSGVVADFADSGGAFSTERAAADLTLVCDGAPSALLDALLEQDGLLADVLGPTTGARIEARGVPREGGTLSGRMQSSRAALSLDGHVSEGLFRLDEPATLSITEVGPDLGRRVFRAMPLIGTIEKREGDDPARVTIRDLALPLEGGAERLDAALTVDLGAARFTPSRLFAPALRMAEWRVDADVGQRLAPIELGITGGVLAFDGLKIPLGEFTIETRGEVDLARRTRDLVVYVPFGALAEDFSSDLREDIAPALRSAGAFGQALPSFEKLTRIPFRVRGGLDADASLTPDVELLIRENFRDALRPERFIEKGLSGVLDDLLRGRGKKDSDSGGDDGGGG